MSKHSILLVDDEQNVVRSLKRQFIDTDYKIYGAFSGEEGLELLAQHEIALVISDYRMPGLNGVQFLSKVKEMYPQTIRIILSGYADVASIVEAINDGNIYKFIAKPWNEQELLTAIHRSLEHYDLQKENDGLIIELQTANEELQRLTENLHKQVKERTRDLELKNRALVVAQRILHLLPVGVIGVDKNETLVYMNQAMSQYAPLSMLLLGERLEQQLSEPPLDLLRQTLQSGRATCSAVGGNGGIRIICSPLPEGAGAIGLFSYEDITHHQKRADYVPETSEVAHAR